LNRGIQPKGQTRSAASRNQKMTTDFTDFTEKKEILTQSRCAKTQRGELLPKDLNRRKQSKQRGKALARTRDFREWHCKDGTIRNRKSALHSPALLGIEGKQKGRIFIRPLRTHQQNL
jgi:hypothetical protein